MKLKILFILAFIPVIVFAQNDFNKNFKKSSFRFDFYLGGNSEEVTVYPQQMKQEPFWAGSITNLIDTFNYGNYRFCITDSKSDSLLFLKGFSTLFQEWQTTAEATETNKSFYHAAIFPFPRKNFKIEIDERQWNGNFKTIYSAEINPNNYFIQKEKTLPYEIIDILNNGEPAQKVDLVILAEGYTQSEMNKFTEDARRVTNYLFEEEPFKSESKKFNVKAIFTPSLESGTDIPGHNIYKNTCFNSTFYTFDVERYLTTSDMKSVYDVAASVPYDHIYVLVNTERYGGGGFYNFVSVCSSDDYYTKEVFIHEFGHGFAGLGDEYYTSDVAYEEFYNLEAEPWEPNLTTLVDFKTKWHSMMNDSIPIPTPRKLKYNKTVGVFEGGGYTSTGIFSPYMNCRMKTNDAGGFCPVCSAAIKKVIDFYTK